MVILTTSTLTEQKRIGEFCHANGIYFIVADTRGLFGYVAFCNGSWLYAFRNDDSVDIEMAYCYCVAVKFSATSAKVL